MIKDLELSRNQLKHDLEEKEREIILLKEQIQKILFEKETSKENFRQEINDLLELYQNKDKELKSFQNTLEEKNKEIKKLNEKILEIEKPFNSHLGKTMAKVLNLFFKIFK